MIEVFFKLTEEKEGKKKLIFLKRNQKISFSGI